MKERVLIIDDESDQVEFLRAILKKHLTNSEIITAFDGPSGVKAAGEKSPDLILLDARMPAMDGFEVCRRLKADSGTDSIPVMMISGQMVDTCHRVGALEAGVDGYLCKPFDIEELIALVHVLLRLKRKEDELRRHEAQMGKRLQEHEEHVRNLARVVEQSAESIFITDTQGTIQYVNSGFEKITGYTKDEVLGKNPRILKGGRHDKAYYKAMWETLAHGESWTGRFTNLRKDGSVYDAEQTISPILDTDGRIVNYVSVSQDLSRELQLEAEFRQAQKQESIGRLAGGVAHDFNNLLTAILCFGEIILGRIEEDHSLRTDIEEIVHAGKRAAKLTQQLLAIGRKQMANMQPLDLNIIALDMDNLLRRTLGEDIELVTLLPESLKPVLVDDGFVEQIIMNLAVNARDAMPDGGKLTLETSNEVLDVRFCHRHVDMLPGRYVRLVIQDEGFGMPPDVHEHAFEPFYTTKGRGKGTGLGLSTVYGIVKQCKGHILVESEENVGTRFEMYFPVYEGSTADIPNERQDDVQGGDETILLVEDEDTVRRVTGRILESYGYQVLQAKQGEEGLRTAENHDGPIHLVLTDVVMPQLGGPEMVEYLRTICPEAQSLFMSGFTEGRAVEWLYDEEGIELLLKPFTRHILASKVREMLDRSSTASSPPAHL